MIGHVFIVGTCWSGANLPSKIRAGAKHTPHLIGKHLTLFHFFGVPGGESIALLTILFFFWISPEGIKLRRALSLSAPTAKQGGEV